MVIRKSFGWDDDPVDERDVLFDTMDIRPHPRLLPSSWCLKGTSEKQFIPFLELKVRLSKREIPLHSKKIVLHYTSNMLGEDFCPVWRNEEASASLEEENSSVKITLYT